MPFTNPIQSLFNFGTNLLKNRQKQVTQPKPVVPNISSAPLDYGAFQNAVKTGGLTAPNTSKTLNMSGFNSGVKSGGLTIDKPIAPNTQNTSGFVPVVPPLPPAPEQPQNPANPATPATPVVPPETPAQPPVISPFQQSVSDIAKYSQMSPEEVANMEELNRLRASRSLGMANIENKPIPLEFITGQQRALEQRGLALEQPLEARAALLQAQRMGALEGAKATAGILAPKEVSPGSSFVQLNPKTGKYEETYSSPAKETEGGFTLGEGQVRFDKAGNVIASGPAKATEKSTAQNNYIIDTANRTISSVDNALKLVSAKTAGFGAAFSVLPETDARTLRGIVDTIKGNIGFNELTAMRAASPTGGALGQVSERELALLTSVLGSLDRYQSPDVLRKNLEEIKTHLNNWKATVEQGGGQAGSGEYNF